MTDHLPVALRALWHELPLLAAAGVAVCAAAGAVVVVAPGINPFAVLLAALLVAPVWAGVTATTDSVVRGGPGGVVLMLKNIKRYAVGGAATGSVPAIVTAVTLLNWALYDATGRGWILMPLAASGAATVLAVLAAFAAFSLRVTEGLTGRTQWLTALWLVARAPLVPVGVLAVVVVALLVGTSVTASLLLLAPGPIALLASAGTWTTYLGRTA